MNENMISVTRKDHARIMSLLTQRSMSDHEDLELELDRANIIEDHQVPEDLVTMNSKIRYTDLRSKKEFEITLVYPADADSKENKVSILAPLGSALIGLKVGEEIEWTFPNGLPKKLKVLEVVYQPEANKDWHL